jgi:ABC-type multidrug transport system fused ATPase/permease subunit
MDNGQIAESGTHDELIVNGGIYHGLWAVQTGKRL